MDIKRLNIIFVMAALSALAGCSTTHTTGYSHDTPIMSAADARSMIHVEVHAVEQAPTEEELVAATNQRPEASGPIR